MNYKKLQQLLNDINSSFFSKELNAKTHANPSLTLRHEGAPQLGRYLPLWGKKGIKIRNLTYLEKFYKKI